MIINKFFQFILSGLLLCFMTSCQEHQIYKPTVFPTQIILNNQTRPQLPKQTPEIGQIYQFSHYPISTTTLANGLSVYHIQTHHLTNSTTLYALSFIKNEQYPQVLNDLFLNWNSLLIDPTNAKKKPQRLSTLAANAGAIIQNFSINKISGKYLLALKKDSDSILYLLSHLVTGLYFTDQELKLVKQNIAMMKQTDSISGHYLTWQLFKKTTFPESSSNLMTPTPALYQKQRQQASLIQFKQFVKNSLRPENAILILLSPVSLKSLKPRIEHYFSKWHNAKQTRIKNDTPRLNPNSPQHFKTEEFLAIERAGSTQVDIRIGFWPQRLTNKQLQSLRVLSELLAGGGLASRMTYDLREKKGLTYFISSSIAQFGNLQSLQFISSTEPHKLPALLGGMEQHIQSALNENITRAEFKAIKQRLVIKMQRNLLSDFQQLGQIVKLVADENNEADKISDLASQSLLLAQLRYADFLKALQQLKLIPRVTLLAGDKNQLQHHLCNYKSDCKIHWYNKELK